MLGEDLPLILGQQDRLLRGGDTWSFPVSYDKIGVRYRRWRNSVAAGDLQEGSEASSLSELMSAGELFKVEQEEEGEMDGACEVTEDEWKEMPVA